ncbi:MAG: molybdate ABC transporter substrate-binding protein [Clostridia bacterium]|nr:molybdate ABC transporter substrate-binding protein [Clostridia bacterium]
MKNRAARVLGLNAVCDSRASCGLAFSFASALSLLIIFAPLFVSCSKAAKKTELTILAAASLTDVCADLKAEWQKQNPGTELLFSFGGSGALQAQIEAGAPCDVFISAAKKQMDALVQQNLMENGSVANLLQNEVVLILPKNSAQKISSFEELASPAVQLVAVGEPQSVPSSKSTGPQPNLSIALRTAGNPEMTLASTI